MPKCSLIELMEKPLDTWCCTRCPHHKEHEAVTSCVTGVCPFTYRQLNCLDTRKEIDKSINKFVDEVIKIAQHCPEAFKRDDSHLKEEDNNVEDRTNRTD